MDRPMFSKRHYESIADCLNRARTEAILYCGDKKSALEGIDIAEKYLIDLFSEDNPRFDIYRFKKASKGLSEIVENINLFTVNLYSK